LYLKTDSFVVESNVHFPTDYNLLWDSSRKALDIIEWFKKKNPRTMSWRKSHDWFRSLKNFSRAMGNVCSSGGKNKEKRIKQVTRKYLVKARAFRDKLEKSKDDLGTGNKPVDSIKIMELDTFIDLINKHIDLMDRRLLKGEKIPHSEKLFSIFEQYTEWITKGKRRPNVELGKAKAITTDQYGLIVDAYLMNNESDSRTVTGIATRVLAKYDVASWSFDKGYWHKDNKIFLQKHVPSVVMPKKGKPSKAEKQEEQAPSFKKTRDKHSAVESNINELEHCGLGRCPDRGFHGFKRYASIAIVAYNLKRTGREMLKQEREAINKKNKKPKLRQAA